MPCVLLGGGAGTARGAVLDATLVAGLLGTSLRPQKLGNPFGKL